MKIHEIVVTKDGVIKKKKMPTDTFYSVVNIRESRIRRKRTDKDSYMETETVEREETQAPEQELNEINCDNRRRRIMTAEDIEAELDQESNYTDFDSDSEDDD